MFGGIKIASLFWVSNYIPFPLVILNFCVPFCNWLLFIFIFLTQLLLISFYLFKALAEKLNLGKESVANFALFEIMDDGFGKLTKNTVVHILFHPVKFSLKCLKGN